MLVLTGWPSVETRFGPMVSDYEEEDSDEEEEPGDVLFGDTPPPTNREVLTGHLCNPLTMASPASMMSPKQNLPNMVLHIQPLEQIVPL